MIGCARRSVILRPLYIISNKTASAPIDAFATRVTSRCANKSIARHQYYCFRPQSTMTGAQKKSAVAQKETAVAQEEHAEGPNDWKRKAPYRIHESNDGFDALYEAACHCGRVEYELSREEPLDSKLCHCTTCQKQHAAPFQWAAIFHKEDINFRKGHHDLEWYDPSSKAVEHKLPCKVRCSFCHSPIMDEGRNMILVFPSLIKFKNEKEKKKFAPRMHMFYTQRCIDFPDNLPKWTGLNNDSELIEGSPSGKE